MITTDFFLELYPQFNNFSQERIDHEIAIANEKVVNLAVSELLKDEAMMLLVAHKLYLETESIVNIGWEIKAIEIGDEMQMDSRKRGSDDYYQKTDYGRAYLEIRNSGTVVYPILA